MTTKEYKEHYGVGVRIPWEAYVTIQKHCEDNHLIISKWIAAVVLDRIKAVEQKEKE
jgi:hypothetical protein